MNTKTDRRDFIKMASIGSLGLFSGVQLEQIRPGIGAVSFEAMEHEFDTFSLNLLVFNYITYNRYIDLVVDYDWNNQKYPIPWSNIRQRVRFVNKNEDSFEFQGWLGPVRFQAEYDDLLPSGHRAILFRFAIDDPGVMGRKNKHTILFAVNHSERKEKWERYITMKPLVDATS